LIVFVPNDGIGSRRLYIEKSLEYGALWAPVWDERVTHIIVCGNLDLEQASKAFKSRLLPVRVIERTLAVH
jgi:hypothetical protein